MLPNASACLKIKTTRKTLLAFYKANTAVHFPDCVTNQRCIPVVPLRAFFIPSAGRRLSGHNGRADPRPPQAPFPSQDGGRGQGAFVRVLRSFTEANGSSFQLHASSDVFTKQAPAVSQAFGEESRTRFRLQHQTLGKGVSTESPAQMG